MKEKKARVEDALHATRAAVEEGIVPGGGTALLRTIPAIEKLKLEGDEQIGVDILRNAVEAPLRSLAASAGLEGAVIVNDVQSKKGNTGFNVATEEYDDLIKAGVVDEVTRSACRARRPSLRYCSPPSVSSPTFRKRRSPLRIMVTTTCKS